MWVQILVKNLLLPGDDDSVALSSFLALPTGNDNSCFSDYDSRDYDPVQISSTARASFGLFFSSDDYSRVRQRRSTNHCHHHRSRCYHSLYVFHFLFSPSLVFKFQF